MSQNPRIPVKTRSPLLKLSVKLTDSFFDFEKVHSRIEAGRYRALSKIGAFIRHGARRSLRRRKTPSNPRTPPSVHSKDAIATLKNVLFAYDAKSDSVVVGPVQLNQINQTMRGFRLTVPQLHEHGGRVRIDEIRYKSMRGTNQGWRRRDFRRSIRLWQEVRSRLANYPKRKFMEPALHREIRNGKLLQAWRDVI